MALSCKEIPREISNYIDDEVDPEVRPEMEAHLAQCRHCAALLDGTNNIIVLIADERTYRVPAGFSKRLCDRVAREIADRGGEPVRNA